MLPILASQCSLDKLVFRPTRTNGTRSTTSADQIHRSQSHTGRSLAMRNLRSGELRSVECRATSRILCQENPMPCGSQTLHQQARRWKVAYPEQVLVVSRVELCFPRRVCLQRNEQIVLHNLSICYTRGMFTNTELQSWMKQTPVINVLMLIFFQVCVQYCCTWLCHMRKEGIRVY